MELIADETVLFESPSPETVYCFTPSILRLASGRLVASFDLGGSGVAELDGPKSETGDFGASNQLRILLSDDRGRSWRETARLPMRHARIFAAGDRLYALGHAGRLLIAATDRDGECWGGVCELDRDCAWHQSAGAVDRRHGRIYLVMERQLPGATWPGVAPVLMSAAETDDLCEPANWRFSAPCRFAETVRLPNQLGVPLLPTGWAAPGRFCGDPGWLESHVLRIYDPDHLFFDPEDRSMLVLMRAHTGLANLGMALRGVEEPDGGLRLEPLRTPGGAELLYVPLPGGQMKFFVLYDPVGGRYWMCGSQTTDSMIRPDRLPPERFGLPDNERNRLALYWSRNLFDWVFAGLAAVGASPREARHYPAMTVDGDDLLILARSGDRRARSAHNGNLITLHRVRNFRKLAR